METNNMLQLATKFREACAEAKVARRAWEPAGVAFWMREAERFRRLLLARAGSYYVRRLPR